MKNTPNIIYDEQLSGIVISEYYKGEHRMVIGVGTFPNQDSFIRWLFKDRCILCFQRATEIHEIEPKSSGKESMYWKNRVTLCTGCHTQNDNSVHHRGCSDEVKEELRQAREKILKLYGREQYV